MFTLRPDQVEFKAGIRTAMLTDKRVLGVAPTGFGKTVVFSDITRGVAAKGKSIVLMAHRVEIIDQIIRALRNFGVDPGIIAPNYPTHRGPVQVAMVQTLANRLDTIARPDLMIVDEAHHSTAGSYQKIASAWPDIYNLGVSATPQRTDGTGLGSLYGKMVLAPSTGELIAAGRLSRFRYFKPPQVVDLTGIASRGGDYSKEQVAAAMDRAKVTGDAIQHYARHLNGRPAIAFCASVAHAEHVAEQFRAARWKAESIDGAMDRAVRKERIAAIGNGGLNVLTSCDVISEGTDIPAVAGAILLRPTMSLIVFLQQVGRVLRVKADGSHAIILDHVGNLNRFGMPDAPRQWSLEGMKSRERQPVPPVRQCPSCFCCHAPSPRCPECGHEYETTARVRVIKQVKGELVEQAGDIPDVVFMGLSVRNNKLRDLEHRVHCQEDAWELRNAMGFNSYYAIRLIQRKKLMPRSKYG